jgi:hypothetical protein
VYLADILLNLEMGSTHRDEANPLSCGSRMLKLLVRPDPRLTSSYDLGSRIYSVVIL